MSTTISTFCACGALRLPIASINCQSPNCEAPIPQLQSWPTDPTLTATPTPVADTIEDLVALPFGFVLVAHADALSIIDGCNPTAEVTRIALPLPFQALSQELDGSVLFVLGTERETQIYHYTYGADALTPIATLDGGTKSKPIARGEYLYLPTRVGTQIKLWRIVRASGIPKALATISDDVSQRAAVIGMALDDTASYAYLLSHEPGEGRVYKVSLNYHNVAPTVLYESEAHLHGTLTVANQRLWFVDARGHIDAVCLDLNQPTDPWELDLREHGKANYRFGPVFVGDSAYLAFGKTLRKLDPVTRSIDAAFETAGRITAQPLLAYGLLIAADSHGNAFGLDPATLDVVWQTKFNAPPNQRWVVDHRHSPVLMGTQVVFGGYLRDEHNPHVAQPPQALFALPALPTAASWAWVAQHSDTALDKGAALLMQAKYERDPNQSEALRNRAADMWKAAYHYEKTAKLLEYYKHYRIAAECYEDAARQNLTYTALAAEYYRKAYRCVSKRQRHPELSETYKAKSLTWGALPYLQIEEKGRPRMKMETGCCLNIEVRNTGDSDAVGLKVFINGDMLAIRGPIVDEPAVVMPRDATVRMFLAGLYPTKVDNTLEIEVHFGAQGTNETWRVTHQMELSAYAETVINVGDMALSQVTLELPTSDEPVVVNVGNMAKSKVEMKKR